MPISKYEQRLLDEHKQGGQVKKDIIGWAETLYAQSGQGIKQQKFIVSQHQKQIYEQLLNYNLAKDSHPPSHPADKLVYGPAQIPSSCNPSPTAAYADQVKQALLSYKASA